MAKVKHAEYFQLYVWELPVRIFHWINVLSIFVLGVTGYLIAKPLPLMSAGDASSLYLFGTIRFVHFVFAYIFTINFLARLYWGFVGNSFSRWKNYFPTSPRKWREIFQVMCIDIFLICRLPIKSYGVNALAGIIYMAMYAAMVFQIFTGFALYSVVSTTWAAKLFTWMIPLMGGVAVVQQWHHVLTWVFLGFTMMHIYLGWYHDYLEGRGTISSMVGGWKFIEKPEPE
jgi:Ni/Fe-hydrogenase 1 B-type cytochrome subunit